jgi:hypothetical protein
MNTRASREKLLTSAVAGGGFQCNVCHQERNSFEKLSEDRLFVTPKPSSVLCMNVREAANNIFTYKI